MRLNNKMNKTIRNKHLNEVRIAREVKGRGPAYIKADNPAPLNYATHTSIDENEYHIQDEVFIGNMQRFANELARTVNLEDANVGIQDMNDVLQEAYVAYYEAYERCIELDSVVEQERGEAFWGYVHSAARNNMYIQLRKKKDGQALTQWAMFQSKEKKDTNIFSQHFPDMDLFEDLSTADFSGFNNMIQKELVKEIARVIQNHNQAYVVKAFFGIGVDSNGNTYRKGHSRKVIARAMGVTEIAVKAMKQKAMAKLSTDRIKQIIVETYADWHIGMTREMWKYFKKLHFSGVQSEKTILNILWGVRKRVPTDTKDVLTNIDNTIRNSHYGYVDHSLRVRNSIPSAEETFSDRSSAINSLIEIEAMETLEYIEENDTSSYGDLTMYVTPDEDEDDYETLQNKYL